MTAVPLLVLERSAPAHDSVSGFRGCIPSRFRLRPSRVPPFFRARPASGPLSLLAQRKWPKKGHRARPWICANLPRMARTQLHRQGAFASRDARSGKPEYQWKCVWTGKIGFASNPRAKPALTCFLLVTFLCTSKEKSPARWTRAENRMDTSTRTAALPRVRPGSGHPRTIMRRRAIDRLIPTSPIKERRHDVADQRRQQRERQRHVQVQPDLHQRLELDVARHARGQRLLARDQIDQLAHRLALLVGGAAGEEIDHREHGRHIAGGHLLALFA